MLTPTGARALFLPLRAGRDGRALCLVAGCVFALLSGGCAVEEHPSQEQVGSPLPTVSLADGPLDLVLAGGRVIDPETELDAVRHVGVRGKVIVAVSEAPLDSHLAEGGQLLDVSGLVVAPGFIDMHAHGQSEAAHEYQARDGVTTALELEWGYPDVGAFLESRRGKSRVNYGASVSHGTLRALGIVEAEYLAELRAGFAEAGAADEPLRVAQRAASDTFYSPLTAESMPVLIAELEGGLEQGGLGVGMAHQYFPGADRREVFEVFRFAADKQVPIYTHVRSMTLDAMQEVLSNAASTGAPLHIVHVNSMSLGNIETVLEMIRGARDRGVDVSTEAYPYTAGSTGIDSAIFDDGWQEKLDMSYGDVQWQDTGERLTRESFERYREQGGTVIIHMMKEEWIEHALGNEWVIVASDGMPYAPGAHPRTAGTFARVLGRYVRELEVLGLPTAIRKMTLLPAQRLESVAPQMARKGRVQPGADADLVVFDPSTVIDTATFEDDLSFSQGIVHVLVNGVPVVRDGETVPDAFPGVGIRGRYALSFSD